jgi:hypothetical protein
VSVSIGKTQTGKEKYYEQYSIEPIRLWSPQRREINYRQRVKSCSIG